jgi:alpha-galactosidase
VTWKEGGVEQTVSTSSPGARSIRFAAFDDALGGGLRGVLENATAKGPIIRTHLQIRQNATFATVYSDATWPAGAGEGVTVLKLSPLVADTSARGALFLGADPSSHKILDNGYDMYFDYTSRVYRMGDENSLLFGPGAASNYNMAIYDPATGKSATGGFMSMEQGIGIVAADFNAASAITDGGRKGFTRYEAFVYYMDGKPPAAVEGGSGLTSGLFYLDLAPRTVFDGLENWASRYAKRIGKKIWTDIPTGWNSWGGGSSAGGYGTDIDRALIMENLGYCASDFKPWANRYFMIDDGWQIGEGDWDPNPERFPPSGAMNGMEALAGDIIANGLIPGIWIAPFGVLKNSALAKEHPDWLLKPAGMGSNMVPSDMLLLDLSHPEALDWVEATFKKIHGWGYRWFKVDFTYYAMFMSGMHDPTQTQWEAYRNAVGRIRGAVGPDSFVVGIAGNGVWMDFADGQRITLDNQPTWGDPPEKDGDKITYLSFARKYYMSNRLWLNHLDLLFLKETYGQTQGEARAMASAMVLAGGVFKTGDSYELLHQHPEWRSVVHRMTPVYPHSGRPLDLFEREYPELWELKAQREGKSWSVVGLFNWGQNRDIGAKDYEAEGDRAFSVDLKRFGFAAGDPVLSVDSWTGQASWIYDEVLKATLKPRTDRVFILRGAPSQPAFVHTSRHLLGTAVELHQESWDDAAGKLSALVDTVAGDAISITVATAGKKVKSAAASGAGDIVITPGDAVAAVEFTPVQAGTLVEIMFE